MAQIEPMDAFVLVSRRKYSQKDRPVVRVDGDTYATLTKLAARSGLSLAVIVSQAVRYAVDRLVWVEED